MKSTTLVYAIAAVSLSFASLSFAQTHERRSGDETARISQRGSTANNDSASERRNTYPQHNTAGRTEQTADSRNVDRRDGRNDYRNVDRHGGRGDSRNIDRRDGRNDFRNANRHDGRNDFRNVDRRDNRSDYRNDRRQFGAHGPQFYRGGHLPKEYRNQQYVVDNWRPHRLSAPPRGHQWVQVGADYVLIAVATGIIAQMVLSH